MYKDMEKDFAAIGEFIERAPFNLKAKFEKSFGTILIKDAATGETVGTCHTDAENKYDFYAAFLYDFDNILDHLRSEVIE